MLASIALLPATAESAAPSAPTLAVSPTTLTPYVSGGCYTIAPCYRAYGHTDTAVRVTLEVTDAFGGKVSAWTYSAERTDPGTGISAGDFQLAPSVTGLGTHDATPSTLTFIAYAEDAQGNKSAPSAPVTITKLAATPGDETGPTITLQGQKPPGTICGTGWCNTSTCALESAGIGSTGRGCTGTYKMAGSAEDNHTQSSGVASEIADVVLTSYDSSGNVVATHHGLGQRRGTQGFWAVSIFVSDYEAAKNYSWSLVAIDALGNQSEPITGQFSRYPL